MAEQKFAGILTKLKRGIGRPVKEGEDPWQCDVHKGEIVVEIPLNERSTTDHTSHNFRLYTEPEITLYAQPTDVFPLYGAEADYLLAVHPPSVRYREYLSSENLKEKMKLKAGDIVIFKWKIKEDAPDTYVRGKIQYLGKFPEKDGVYFGIEILVSYWIITLYNLYMYLYRRNNIVVKVLLMVLHILVVVLIMLYMLLWIR